MKDNYSRLMGAVREYLPQSTTHYDITRNLHAYRSGENYLSLKFDGINASFHKSYRNEYQTRTVDFFVRQLEAYMALYREENQPKELTLDEIAAKFNIPVSQIRIKD